MRPPVRRLLLVIVLIAVGLAVWLTLFRDGAATPELLFSGTVEATESRLGFQASGRIETVRFREGDRVQTGQELAVLDRTEALARRDQASAQVAAARAALDELERGFRPEEVGQARAARETARIRLDDARRDRERTQRLYDGGAVSRETLDKVETSMQVALSQLEQAEEQLRLVESGYRRERIEAQRAQLQAAEASLRVVEATLANMVITAPGPGVVTVRHHEPGETVPPGAAVLTVMDPSDRWIRIYVREDRVGAVSLGQGATIRSDTYPERSYEGEVSFIASEAEFTPKNVQTAEERVKLVYAVKVRVIGDPGFELKPGMPADVALAAGAP